MRTRTIRDGFSGQPTVIENPLMPEHVKVGTLLWYTGSTSVSGWNCPAVITQVDAKKRFKVRSLDDMREQDQWYGADPEKDTTSSRQTMRLVDANTVKEYLDKRREMLSNRVIGAVENLESANKALAYFDEILGKLKLA